MTLDVVTLKTRRRVSNTRTETTEMKFITELALYIGLMCFTLYTT